MLSTVEQKKRQNIVWKQQDYEHDLQLRWMIRIATMQGLQAYGKNNFRHIPFPHIKSQKRIWLTLILSTLKKARLL